MYIFEKLLPLVIEEDEDLDKSFGPANEIRIAPSGAVRTIDRMHIIITIFAYSNSSAVPLIFFIESNARGPRAA